MAAKTIAFVLPNLGAGGAERVAMRLMHSFLEAGHKVHFVLVRKEGELLEQVPPQVEIVDLKATRIRDAVLPLARYLRERRPDAVQARMWPLTIAAIVARRLARSPARLVVSDHVAYSKELAQRPLARAVLRRSIRFFYPMADVRLQVAEAAADDLAALSGLPRQSLEVVYNPVTAPPPDMAPSPEVEALWGDADCRIITVGSLKHQKNQELLIRSFARVRAGRSAKLMLVGTGALLGQLRQLAAELGVAEDVIFAGYAPEPFAYYASADLFVLSSDYEGYPNVLVEAMRCGVPVVSTDCESGPREILDGGRYGKLVPVGDEAALAAAMDETLRRPPAGELLRERAEALSGSTTAQRYLELLIGQDGA